jgi:hypothetical protein
MAKKNMKFKRYEGGGEIMSEADPKETADKEAGLKASKGEDVGFLQRLRMGNIDDPSSEAYKRFGAGRGRATPAPAAEEEAPKPQAVARPPAKPNPIFAAGLEQGKRQPSGDASVAEDYSGPRTKPIVTTAEKPAASKPTAPKPTESKPKETEKTKYEGPTRGQRSDAGTSPPVQSSGRKSEDKSSSSQIPGQSTKAPEGGEKADSSETSRNISNAMNALGVTAGVGGAAAGAYKLKKMYDASKKAKAALLKNPRLERPGTVSGKDFVVRDYEGAAKTASKGVPKKQLGFKKDSDVTDVTPKTKNWRSETNPTKREDARADAARDSLKNFLNRDLDRGMKKGGSVNKYSSGGMTSSASRRADGIATKGKTRGKMC